MSTESSEPKRVSFSVPQILGGALAAATAATIGSTLGVAGTIIGAAVASVVGAVAGTLYTAGIDRGTRGAWAAMRRGFARVVEGKTDGETGPHTARDVSTQPRRRPDRRRLWWAIGGSVAGAALIFVIAFAAITGVELMKGSSLSGGKGTTVSKVVKAPPAPPASPTPTPKPSRPAPTPTREVTPEPSAPVSPSPEPSATAPSAEAPTQRPSEPPQESAPTDPGNTPATPG